MTYLLLDRKMRKHSEIDPKLLAKAKAIEAKRSPAAKKADESRSNQQRLGLTKENVEKWAHDPGRYDLQGVDTIKKIAALFSKLRKKAEPRAPREPRIVAYTKKDLEAARSYLEQHKDLYDDGPHYIELQAEIAKAIHDGIDPAVIDYAAHLSDDKSLHESLRDEWRDELLEARS